MLLVLISLINAHLVTISIYAFVKTTLLIKNENTYKVFDSRDQQKTTQGNIYEYGYDKTTIKQHVYVYLKEDYHSLKKKKKL